MEITLMQTKELVELLEKRKAVKLILERAIEQPHKTKTHWRLRISWGKHEAIYTSFRGKERTWTNLDNALNRIHQELNIPIQEIVLIH